jgi:carbon-monoxide dehydrogenase large subunit
MVGNAVYKAVQDGVGKLKANAAIALGLSPKDMVYDGKRVFYKHDPKCSVPLEKLMMGYTFPNGHTSGCPPVGYGAYMPQIEFPDKETGQGNLAAQWTYGCQGVVLDVDLYTGEIFLRMVSSSLDIGKVINPMLARSQVEGAVVMGIGGAIMESILYRKGEIRNPDFTDYKIPTCQDVVDIELRAHFVETPDTTMVYGAKCLGEHPVIGIAPAILSALMDAVGLDFNSLPFQASAVREKIKSHYSIVCRYIGKKRASYVPAV